MVLFLHFNLSVPWAPDRNNIVIIFLIEIVLGIDKMGSPDWRLTLLLLFCWILVCLGLLKGVASLGKVSYFTAIFPYILITVLIVNGATLPGESKHCLVSSHCSPSVSLCGSVSLCLFLSYSVSLYLSVSLPLSPSVSICLTLSHYVSINL